MPIFSPWLQMQPLDRMISPEDQLKMQDGVGSSPGEFQRQLQPIRSSLPMDQLEQARAQILQQSGKASSAAELQRALQRLRGVK